MDDKVTYGQRQKDNEYINDPPQPLRDTPLLVPKNRPSATRKGVRYFAPYKPEGHTQILCLAAAPLPEEARSVIDCGFNREMLEKPALFKGPAATIIRDTIGRFKYLKESEIAYAVVAPWLLPKSRRYRPTTEEVAWCQDYVDELIAELKPDVIVAMGKAAFDALSGMKIAADDARGGWFAHARTKTPLYLTDPPHQLLSQPWRMETLLTDFREVNRFLSMRLGHVKQVDVDYRLIRTEEQLRALVAEWRDGGFRGFSVDCEWHGTQFVDGQLRAIQFCWKDGVAAYLEFYDEHGTYHLGRTEGPDGVYFIDYPRIGRILDEYLDHPETEYYGHQVSADSPWMSEVLKMNVLGRFTFDTCYALQTINEYAELGLENLALSRTDLGRYDMPLVLWKRDNRKLVVGGYGKIPTAIMFPYGCQDVDVVFRSIPSLKDDLEAEGLLGYFERHVMPLVHEGFHNFVVTGLPIDRHRFEAVRAFMNWAYRELLDDFRKHLVRLSWIKLATEITPEQLQSIAGLSHGGKRGEAIKLVKEHCASPALAEFWELAPTFNIRSHPQLRLLLFRVLEMTPVRTTGNNPFGLPGMIWEKAMELPDKVRDQLIPACDKETLEILADRDSSGTVKLLLAVNNVGNQCKGFLKEGDKGPDGEVIAENGLAAYIASDDRIHGNFSLTETCRPRSWKPNILNLSSYHNDGVKAGLAQVFATRTPDQIPTEIQEILGEDWHDLDPWDVVSKRMPSVRSAITAPPGWCFAESDYQAAEVRALGFAAGDERLLGMILGSDPYFALYRGKPVRLAYDEHLIAPEHRDPNLLMTYVDADNLRISLQLSDLDRTPDGELKHPKWDLHWLLAETVQHKPREVLNEKRDRTAAKVARFCIAEGELVLTRDRGWVAIEKVLLTDLLWDGVEWVTHEGLIDQGEKEVIFYQGLWATEAHKVWKAEGGWCHLGEARAQSIELLRTLPPGCAAPDFDGESGRRTMRTYDILNAGPRNRFMCSGVIVSNSSVYGAVASTIERRIEATTGIKPEPGTGQRLLEAMAESQPIATMFLDQVAEKPRKGECLKAASGRLRRFPIHPQDLRGMPWRVKKAYLQSMGNEARNFYMQESVAATLGRAVVWLNRFFRQHQMEARTCIGLYDACLTLTPLHERFVAREAHQLFMTDLNVWHYHGRWMNYPTDTDFCYRWSWKTSEEQKKELEDPTWSVGEHPERAKALMDELRRRRELFVQSRPDVVARLNKI